jgi:hypothetical protein
MLANLLVRWKDRVPEKEISDGLTHGNTQGAPMALPHPIKLRTRRTHAHA